MEQVKPTKAKNYSINDIMGIEKMKIGKPKNKKSK